MSQHNFGDYFPGEGVFEVLQSWFVAGVVMVVLDTFRRKTDTEMGVWAIAAISFGLSVLSKAADFVMRRSDTFWPGATGSPLIDVISLILWIPAVLIWFGTMLFGTLIYTLFLTLRAIRSWRAYLRTA